MIRVPRMSADTPPDTPPDTIAYVRRRKANVRLNFGQVPRIRSSTFHQHFWPAWLAPSTPLWVNPEPLFSPSGSYLGQKCDFGSQRPPKSIPK